MISALLIGMIFAFLLKRGRFCPTGTICNIRLEGRWYNALLIATLIATEGCIYYLMIAMGLVPLTNFKSFPLISVTLGSFIFGVGAILSNGCITSSLIKTGDGRITGIISVIVFVLGVSSATRGILRPITQVLASKVLLADSFYKSMPIAPVFIFAIIAVILYVLLFKHYKTHQAKYKLSQKHSGLRHIFCEKIWEIEIVVVLCGILMALAFYFSNKTGRNDGIGITTPLFSWFNLLANNKYNVSWGSMLVFGIVLGSHITARISDEYSLVGTNTSTLIKTIIGSLLMGIGAVWAKGCLVSNGLVGTAQLSMKAWLALIFLTLGIWLGTKIILIRKIK